MLKKLIYYLIIAHKKIIIQLLYSKYQYIIHESYDLVFLIIDLIETKSQRTC